MYMEEEGGQVFNLSFQIVIYHPILSNTSVKLLYSDTPGVVLTGEQPYITQFMPGIIN